MVLIFIKCDHEQCVRVKDDSLVLMEERNTAVPFLHSKVFYSPTTMRRNGIFQQKKQ